LEYWKREAVNRAQSALLANDKPSTAGADYYDGMEPAGDPCGICTPQVFWNLELRHEAREAP
jgi:hypothetical protein